MFGFFLLDRSELGEQVRSIDEVVRFEGVARFSACRSVKVAPDSIKPLSNSLESKQVENCKTMFS